MRKRSMALLVAGSLILSVAACTGEIQEKGNPNSDVELIDPVNSAITYEEAAIRDLYGASVYPANVIPYIEEYGPVNAFSFGAYNAYPGEKVKRGQELISSDTTEIDEKIKAKKEEIRLMEEDYQKYMEKQQKLLKEQRHEEEVWGNDKNNYEREKPEEFITDEDGEEVENPQFAAWNARMDEVTGRYRIAKHSADIIQQEMDQRTALYDLDHKHQEYKLKSLQRTRKESTVTSNMDGYVAAIKLRGEGDFYTPVRGLSKGDWLRADDPVVAVADPSRKILKSDYINKTTIRNAADVYAMINGKRYEVVYHPISAQEYARLSSGGQKIYSTFEIVDAGEEVKVGAYASIAVIGTHCENVVTIPKDAIKKDDLGSYVYVVKDGQSVHTTIQTGFSDGNFTEIVSGLSEGDKVLYTGSMAPGSKTATIARGEFFGTFSERAALIYPSGVTITNPVKNGTVYFTEMMVKNYQHVEKGDVIAKIRVESDRIALERNETRRNRLQERLDDFRKKNEGKEKEEFYIETVKNYDEQIADVDKALAEQKADFSTKVIRTDRAGVVVWLRDVKSEDILQYEAEVAQIADEDTCYVVVQDEKQSLQYGNEVSVIYFDGRNQQAEVTGSVVSASKVGLSSALAADYSFILLPKEQIGTMLQSTLSDDNFWGRYRYTVEAKLRAMDDVLLVPRNAVYEIGGKTYVYVKNNDGSVSLKSFVAGGSNESYYWVVEGLTEGMEICLK